MCVFLAKTICIGITVFYIHCTCRWWWTTWGVLYKKQELLTFLSSPSFCRGLCCCSMFLFSFLCDVVLCWYLSSCAPFCFCPRISPTLMKLSFSSFSVNNCTVHVTTLVMGIKILYRHSADEWSLWFITRYQQSYIIGDIKKNQDVSILLQGYHRKKNELEMFNANKIYGKYRTGNDFFFRI